MNNNNLSKAPAKLINPDKLIISARNTLIKKKHKDYRYSGTVQTARGEINIRVAPVNVGRALRIFDTLIKLLRARNYDIIVRYSKTYAVIQDEELEISLKEKLKIVYVKDHRWERREYHPTGILTFRLEGIYYKEWRDGKHIGRSVSHHHC